MANRFRATSNPSLEAQTKNNVKKNASKETKAPSGPAA
jgi:hypothetical protein